MKIRKLSAAVATTLIAPGFIPQVTAEQLPLEEVIVTAQKRAQSIQDVPISITAFSGDFLEENGVQTFEDVAQITPNFTIATSSQASNNRISIRGIGASGNNAIEPSVGVFIDGVYYPRPGSVIGLLMDIQSFEVLRGPQGTLFGRNTVAGALNITTRNPHHESEGMVELGFGDYDAYEVGAMYNASLSNSVAARVAVKYADRDGYGDNTFDGEDFGARDDLVARGKVLFDFNEQLSMLVTADYSEINAEGNAVELLNSTNTPEFEATTTELYGSSPATKDSYDWKIHQVHRDDFNDEQQGLSLDINYEFGNGLALRSITAYRNWEAENAGQDVRYPVDLLPATNAYDTDTISQEFHLMSPGGETVDWLAGLYYYEEDYDIDESVKASVIRRSAHSPERLAPLAWPVSRKARQSSPSARNWRVSLFLDRPPGTSTTHGTPPWACAGPMTRKMAISSARSITLPRPCFERRRPFWAWIVTTPKPPDLPTSTGM
jgi:iron complex outermembrane receptor protein